MPLMPKQIRRVVTGHDATGRSTFIIDAPTPHVFQRTKGSAIVHELWETTRTPADNRGSADAIARGHRLAPPQHGSVFRVIEYPPDSQRLAAIAREEHLPDDGSGRAAATDRNKPRHGGFHKTATIDYAIVLSGEIYAMMDDGEVLLKAGDVLIQRGTNHAWSNRTEENAVVAFVLIDAEAA
jgi:mannose-6-phosphate isomerase-like protein (cupin superfamily)